MILIDAVSEIIAIRLIFVGKLEYYIGNLKRRIRL
jgi:hypothetical protein